MGTNAFDGDELGRRQQFDPLNDFRRFPAGNDRAMTIGALGAVEFRVSDVGVVKGLALVRIVVGLPAALFLADGLASWVGFLAEIAGRRLGRIRGVLFENRDLGLEGRDLGSQLLDQAHQSVASSARGRPCRRHDATEYSTAAIAASEIGMA